jgi:hypothetical protein
MLSDIKNINQNSITAQLISTFNYAHETSGSTICPNIN